MISIFKIDEADNVAISFSPLEEGAITSVSGGGSFPVLHRIPVGHKVALEDIKAGRNVIKYGAPIGFATRDIKKGELVHTDNVKTGLSEKQRYKYNPVPAACQAFACKDERPISVFRRKNGKVGIRNELWVVPTVGCVNGVAESIIQAFREFGDYSGIDGVYSFPHPYGCSQLGSDHERTKKILQNIALHPNAGGVLVLGLGCENNQIDTFRETMPEEYDTERLLFLEAQSVRDEVAAGVELLRDLYAKASRDTREPGSWRDITIGLECGGSDAFSGITANPLIGRVSDYVIAHGGAAVLTEVPEMFGAEHILMQQCADETIFAKTVAMINEYKEYYLAHNQPVYENPSPGNKSGGITTLEDKSLGCTRKAGKSPVVDVVKMEERVHKHGLNLLYSPGNDIVATTALGAAGCQLVLFSTGRGTPLGGFIPTVKIASNTILAEQKANWIDFNAGVMADPETDKDEVLTDFLSVIVEVINGEQTSAEERNNREIAIFKTGVTL
jgi:altronate hydrolase